MKIKLLCIQIVVLFAILVAFSVPISAIQVSPLLLNLELSPGESENFYIDITGGTTRTEMTINLVDVVQSLDGRLSYITTETPTNPVLDWIEFENNRVMLPAREVTRIPGTINVPFDAGGSHTAVIMIEESEALDRPGSIMAYRIRYAVRININIDRPSQLAQLEVLDLAIELNDTGRPIIKTHFENKSPLSFPAVADVTIRTEDRRLLERVPVFSPATSLTRRENFRVYPYSELIYRGEITELLYPGIYELQLFMRYADGRQVIQRKTVEIDESYLADREIKHVSFEPAQLSLNLRPGATSTQMIEFSNRTAEPIRIKTNPGEVRYDYPNSIFSNINVEIRGERDFIIPPRRSGRQLLIFRAPRELASGGYYGFHNIEVYNQAGELLETHFIELDALIGTDIKMAAAITDLIYNQGEREDLFSLTVKNEGRKAILPQARLELIDAAGDLYANIYFDLDDTMSRVLPDHYGHYLGERSGRITPGQYTARVFLTESGQELDSQDFVIEID